MGCNRLAVTEDAEAVALARQLHIPIKQALRIVVQRRLAQALGEQLMLNRERVARIERAAEDAAKLALWAEAAIKNKGTIYNDLTPGDQRHKGAFGEGATALNLYRRGFEPIAIGTAVQGIDSIWVRQGTFYVVESKHDGSRLAPGQMTPTWIADRLAPVLGGDQELARHIATNGHVDFVSHSGAGGVVREGFVNLD
jgi:hypothetical protein